jgi:hypothetical protein
MWLFVHEIDVQCRWALAAIADMQANLQQHSAEGVFFFMHAFLTHAANVSKIVWPSEAKVQGSREGDQGRTRPC